MEVGFFMNQVEGSTSSLRIFLTKYSVMNLTQIEKYLVEFFHLLFQL